MKEAEANKEADNKRKEEAEIRNDAEQMVFATENAESIIDNIFSKELKDKEKDELTDLKDELNKALEGDDTDKIKEKTQKLSDKVMEVSSRIYQEQAAESQANAEKQPEEADDKEEKKSKKDKVKDADFEEK